MIEQPGRTLASVLVVLAAVALARPACAIDEAWLSRLDATPETSRLRAWHDAFCAFPHPAGSKGDAQMIELLADGFTGMGLEVDLHRFTAYLSEPVAASLEIVAAPGLDAPLELPIIERPVMGDPWSAHPDAAIGWNAFAASGDVVGEVVYVNRGRKEDFEALRRHGVDLTGRIAIARYGGNYRGYKAKFAEEAGAIGLIIYTDPADSGYRRGELYPRGGWANETSIQRGSIKTLPYPGDPLTPGVEATPDAPRLDADAIALPRIPVQPVGWAAAREILGRMEGRSLPNDLRGDWQGGLPFAYRLTGAPDLRVRLMVEQRRANVETANVLGILRGAVHPEEVVVVGCHFDAWSFGASDPHAGSIVMYEVARSFVEAAQAGQPPARTIVFANWGAEEFGIIGSTEWVEGNLAMLEANAVAYVNLDMAAMGTRFRASASPSLKQVIALAADGVPHPSGEHTVLDLWRGEANQPSMGSLGGGSDHIGFYCLAGVPSCGIGAGGSPGTSYHSNYDTLAWYRQVVGDDYEAARMVARVCNRLVALLAQSAVPPLDPVAYAADGRRHLEVLAKRATALEVEVDLAPALQAIARYEPMATRVAERLAAESPDLAPAAQRRVTALVNQLERCWLRRAGLPDRPWYRNLYAANDPDSGYAAWMFPMVRRAIEDRDEIGAATAVGACVEAYDRLAEVLGRIEGELAGR